MRNTFIRGVQYLVITAFVSFLMYMISPIFPGLSRSFSGLAADINKHLGTSLNVRVASIVLTIIAFLILYLLLSYSARVLRQKAGIEWNLVDPMAPHKSVEFSLFKALLIILFIPLIYGFSTALVVMFRNISISDSRILAFAAGFAAWTITWLIFWKKWGFFSTLEHEITHMIMGMCFFHKPKALVVHEYEGGWVQLAGVNFLITLAPYFLLTLCFLMLPLFLVIQPQFYLPYFFIMGIFTSYHTFSTIRETSFSRQPDIVFTGKLFSLFVIVLGNIFCYGFIIAFVIGGFPRGGEFISQGWQAALALPQIVYHRIF